MEVGTILDVNGLINSLLPMMPYGVMVFHEPIRMSMEGLLLGVNTGNGCSLWAIKSFTCMLIRELVDSLCRDATDTHIASIALKNLLRTEL